jgi:hypothetical protein
VTNTVRVVLANGENSCVDVLELVIVLENRVVVMPVNTVVAKVEVGVDGTSGEELSDFVSICMISRSENEVIVSPYIVVPGVAL